jgi:spore germination protein YaaH
MAQSAHQIEVEDLKAAGLNPILSGTGGMGANVPSIGLPQQNDAVTPAVNSGLAAYKNSQEVENMKTTNENLKETTNNIQADTDKKISDKVLNNRQSQLTEQLIKKATADTEVSNNSAKNSLLNNQLLQNQLPKAINDANAEKIIGPKAAKFDRFMESLGHLNPFTSSAKNLSTMGK